MLFAEIRAEIERLTNLVQQALSRAGAGGSGPDHDAVVFSPAAATPSTCVVSARSAHQSPITGTPVGATNLGSDTTGASPGVSGNYASLLGGNACRVLGDYSTCPGGLGVTTCGIASFATGFGSGAIGDYSCAQGQTTAFGGAAHSEGLAGEANASSSHVEGQSGRTGQPTRAFTVAPGGVNLTLPGVDATDEFTLGNPVTILPGTPVLRQTVSSLTVVSVPVFAAGDTTFDLSGPIDSTTSGGILVDPSVGSAGHVEGNSNVNLGTGGHVEGSSGSNYGDNGHVEGQDGQALDDVARVTGNNCRAWAPGSSAGGVNSAATAPNARAYGQGCTAGTTPQAFTIPAGGVLVTIAGDVTEWFANGDPVRILPTGKRPVTRSIASPPTFGGGSTTFNLNAALNLTSTGGTLVDTAIGPGSSAIGIGAFAWRPGQRSIASGPASATQANWAGPSMHVLRGSLAAGGGDLLLRAGDPQVDFLLNSGKSYGFEIACVLRDPIGDQVAFVDQVAAGRCTAGVATVPTNGFWFPSQGDGLTGNVTGFTIGAPGGRVVEFKLTLNGGAPAVVACAWLRVTEVGDAV